MIQENDNGLSAGQHTVFTEEFTPYVKCNITESVKNENTPSRISPEDVERAIDALESKGSKVNSSTVREYLHKGSFSTIGKMISACYQKRFDTEKNLKLCNLNEKECKRLAEQMVATAAMGNKRFYEQKLYENESQWQNLKKSLASTIDDLCLHNANLETEIKNLTVSLNKARDDLKILQEKISENTVVISELKKAINLQSYTITDNCKKSEERELGYREQIKVLKKLIESLKK